MVHCELEEVVISLYEDVASVVAFAGCEFGEEEAGGVGEYIYPPAICAVVSIEGDTLEPAFFAFRCGVKHHRD